MAKYLTSKTKQKLLVLLLTGVALGLSRSYKTHYKLWKQLPEEFANIDKNYLSRNIRELRKQRLIAFKKKHHNTVKIVLTEEGKRLANRYRIHNLEIKKQKKWDKMWRIIMYDIPEKHKKSRDVLRAQLKTLGFFEMQKSVWVYPYPCDDIIKFLVDMYEIEDYVHYAVVKKISNEKKLYKHFVDQI